MALVPYQLEANKQSQGTKGAADLLSTAEPCPSHRKEPSRPSTCYNSGFKPEISSRARSRFCEACGVELTQCGDVFCEEKDVNVWLVSVSK